MKGFELSIKFLVIISIAIVVLVILGAFFVTNVGKQAGEADAERTFNSRCVDYRDRGCSWKVTREAAFSEFQNACQTLYGENNAAFSCLYVYCCKQASDSTCTGLCSMCKGHKYAGLPDETVNNCLEIFDDRCDSDCNI